VKFDGAALKRLREQRGMSQRELGAAVGVNSATISRLEHGHRQPRAVTVARLAQAFELDVGSLEQLVHD
jgi:transcriptional regulator with XRE-family HTH domain